MDGLLATLPFPLALSENITDSYQQLHHHQVAPFTRLPTFVAGFVAISGVHYELEF